MRERDHCGATPRLLLLLLRCCLSATSQQQTHYEVLGIQPSAKPAEVKRAYYKLAKELHPDRVAAGQRDATAARFKLVATAYEALGDSKARQAYDESLRPRRSTARATPAEAARRCRPAPGRLVSRGGQGTERPRPRSDSGGRGS